MVVLDQNLFEIDPKVTLNNSQNGVVTVSELKKMLPIEVNHNT